MFRTLLLVGIGGAVGSIARYCVSMLLNTKIQSELPLGTLAVNVIGCLIIGLLFGFASRHQWTNSDLILLAGTGFCGGFTTFSSFAMENISLVQKQQFPNAIIYSFISLILGISLCKLGFLLGNKL